MNALVTIDAPNSLPALAIPALAGLSDDDILAAAAAPATRTAYRSDASIFVAWCIVNGREALPALPETVARFLLDQARRGRKPNTLTRRIAAIRAMHKHAGFEPPTSAEVVRSTMKGLRRTLGAAPVKKAAATANIIRQMVDLCADTRGGKRDRAILTLGFALASRRSELVALRVEDLEEVPDGLRVTIRKSKTDQEGAGMVKFVPRGSNLRPVEALQMWLEASGITEGPIFRRVRSNGDVGPALSADGEQVAVIVKNYAKKVGADPKKFAGHSLRAGFITSAADHGANIFKMMDVTGHKSVETLRGYVRNSEGFKDHAGAAFL